ncbi:sigma-70 family RNA polymerase sigma factor [Thermogemmatispora tikiterensis]|uniref:RNA polymerase sigma-70 domain-containing protein n=1 Tax=Thermogemmatispora tikiterensis TaxID=1825093 RepID=A0A328VD77_9CHLR|nr:sigma-70 family RNA polymerase sigma factor [Thermogemmatispora tikiterensis]RAQ93854.1 hypothetical protein A4R35_23570 [Thermogemmatispora tikiterensis]
MPPFGQHHAPPPHIRPRQLRPARTTLAVSSYLADLEAFPPSVPASHPPEARRDWPPGASTQDREALINSHLRLVISVARTYAPLLRDSHPSLELADLIQEGNLGLLEAAKRFDPTHGVRFSTYATWWIRRARAIQAADLIRLPAHVQQRLHARTGRSQQQGSSLPRTVSLDAPTQADHQLVAVIPDQTVPDPSAGDPDETEQQRWLAQAVRRVLTPKQRLVMEALRGWGDRWRPATQAEVGRELGLCRGRILQIKQAAVARLQAAWQRECHQQQAGTDRAQRQRSTRRGPGGTAGAEATRFEWPKQRKQD